MSVEITPISSVSAGISWAPEDDPRGYIGAAVQSDQLAYALEALGDAADPADEGEAVSAAKHTTTLARLLERRAAVQVVRLRDVHGLSWRRIAIALHDDAEKQSSVRRQYDSGRRILDI